MADAIDAPGRRASHGHAASLVLVAACAALLAPSARPSDDVLVTVEVTGPGTVTIDPVGMECADACSTPLEEDTTVTLRANPADGALVVSWSGACAGVEGLTCTISPEDAPSAAVAFAAAPVPTEPEPPPAPPPPGTGGSPGPILQSIDAVLEQLPTANVAFNVPRTLRLGETSVIELRLSGARTIEELSSEITALGDREGAEIKASREMDARLTGLGFRIQAVTPERQSVAHAGVTVWRWEIEASEVGSQRLHLTLSAIIELEGRESPHSLQTFERVLEVRVTWTDRLASFGERNWQWLWAAVLVPVAGWIVRNRGARRRGTG